MTYWTALSLDALGDMAMQAGNYSGAANRYEEALAVNRELRNNYAAVNCLTGLVYAVLCSGDPTQAERLFMEALDTYRALEYPGGAAAAQHSMGDLALARGDLPEAAARYRDGLRQATELAETYTVAACLRGIAATAAVAGQPAAAARLLGAVEAAEEAPGQHYWGPELAFYDRIVLNSRVTYASEPDSAAWAVGRALAIEQAVVEALALADELSASGRGA